jgi:hypothetical protein
MKEISNIPYAILLASHSVNPLHFYDKTLLAIRGDDVKGKIVLPNKQSIKCLE